MRRQSKKDELVKQKSRERLEKIATAKIRTTMIGAIASVEEHFGHLWGEGELDTTPEEEELREAFEDMRSEVLDKGNSQIRNLKAEIMQYDVEWLRYHVDIPIQRTDMDSQRQGENHERA